MFHSIWSKTLREYRIPLLGWGIGMAVVVTALYAMISTQGNQSAADMNQIVQSIRFIADPVSVNTPGGYVYIKDLDSFGPLAIAIWALLAGARMVRGEEERNSLDFLLAAPVSRTRLLVEKLLALLLALIGIGLLIGVGAIIGEQAAKVTVDAGRALLAGLDISLYAFLYGVLALFLSQFFLNRSTAAGISGTIMAVDFLLSGTARTVQNAEWLQYISPFYYYQINKPLITGYADHPDAAIILIVLALVLSIVSVWLFAYRDTGSTVLAGHGKEGVVVQQKPNTVAILRRAWGDPSTWSVGLRTLRAQSIAMLCWIAGILFYAAYGVYITQQFLKPLQDILRNNPTLEQMLSGHNMTTNAGFISYVVFLFVPIAILIYGMIQALTWSSALDSGRMELILGTPQRRERIQGEHLLVVLLQVVITPILLSLTILISAAAVNISVDGGHVAAASLSILPMSLVVIGFSYACAGRLSHTIIALITTIYLFCTLLLEWLNPMLKLPEWILSLSLFHDYGNPLIDGWHWTPNIVMLIVALVLLGIGFVQFHSANIDKGNA
jgi:Putative exporter of polyketide antibiotics